MPFYTVTGLGDLGGVYSSAWSINEQGEVFGATKTAGGDSVDFIWDSIQGMQIYTGSIWDVKQVNDSGQRLGTAKLNGRNTAKSGCGTFVFHIDTIEKQLRYFLCPHRIIILGLC